MSDTAIRVENLSKKYRLGQIGTGSVSHDLNRWWAKVRGKEDPYSKVGDINDRTISGNSDYAWVLKDINFEVKQGEVLGIIGRNGAGKSTLLKILSKITTPSEGIIKAKGRIASLLEVGTGFHPEMTGRENIYMNGTIMGMTKYEIDRKLDEIIEFAGIAKYIDTPAKRYSSGMAVRLGFAIAAHLEPEILIVDEVLAVGDVEFQKKAIGKMQDVSRGEGRTVLFVSHNLGSIKKLCTKGLVLNQGMIEYNDDVENAISKYLESNSLYMLDEGNRTGNQSIKIVKVEFINSQNYNTKSLISGEHGTIRIYFEKKFENIQNIMFRIQVYDNEGILLTTLNNEHSSKIFKKISVNFVDCKIKKIPFFGGTYNLTLSVFINNQLSDHIDYAAKLYIEMGDFFGTGKVPHNKQGLLVDHQWK